MTTGSKASRYSRRGDVAWLPRGDELFTNILGAMADDVGYSFDRVQLKKGAYSPMAHGEQETQIQNLRRVANEVLSGARPIKMQVTDFPFSKEATDAQIKLQGKLTEAFGEDGTLHVSVVKPEPPAQ